MTFSVSNNSRPLNGELPFRRPRVNFGRFDRAFTLIEVMIAVTLFFAVAFTVLALVSQNLRMARSLQTSHVSAAMIAAQLALTNRLVEGTESGTFDDFFPRGMYPEHQWVTETYLESSNDLYSVDIAVVKGAVIESKLTVLFYKPGSFSAAGAMGRRR